MLHLNILYSRQTLTTVSLVLEIKISFEPTWDPESLPSPRLLASHLSYSLLPNSVLKSGSRIVYICREPKDVFVSMRFFTRKIKQNWGFPSLSLEEACDLFTRGVSAYGPYWDHVLGYYKASLESPPNNILFLKYEEMKENILVQVKKLAGFLGHSFSLRKEESGVVQEIVDLCSFENLQNLEVNRTGTQQYLAKNEWYFRKGEVGDWKNHLTPQMIECLDRVTEQKFAGSGLTFQRQDGDT
uniref:Sulfotransferase n=1 Tax=Rhizophora mucronata TaxID=61149 RepID=A0A2P2LLW4_RHIMU